MNTLPEHINLIGTSTLLFNNIERSSNSKWLEEFDKKCRLATGKGYKELAKQTSEAYKQEILQHEKTDLSI